MTRSVLVPSSLTREAEDKREATRKLGYVARAAVVFRVDRLGSLAERTAANGTTVVFGAPERGLPEILDRRPGEEAPSDEPTARFDLWLNTVPDQGSDVVRTEEALFATLASLTLE